MVSALTSKPVKITMTGPHMLAKVAYDEHYNDIAKMMDDIGKLLRHNFKHAGGGRLQEHPDRRAAVHDERRRAKCRPPSNAINTSIEDLPKDVHVSIHICQGNYAVGKEYDAQIGHRYFDTGRYKADLVCKIECFVLSGRIRHDAPLRRSRGQQAARRRRGRRAGSEGRERRDGRGARQGTSLAGARADHRSRAPAASITCRGNVAFGKLKAMAEAKRILGGSGLNVDFRGSANLQRERRTARRSPRRRGASAFSNGRCRPASCGCRRNSSRSTA